MYKVDLSYVATLPNKVLTIEEIRIVLARLHNAQVTGKTTTRKWWPQMIKGETYLQRHKKHTPASMSAWQQLIVFRLSCCCGLRRMEICNLRLRDLDLHSVRPHILIRSEATKSSVHGPGKRRRVPLWWDNATLEDLRDYEAYLETRNGPMEDPGNPYVCHNSRQSIASEALHKKTIQYRWNAAVKILPKQRRLSIHCGRHSFCTHSLVSGRTVVEVQHAAGHRDIGTTQIYLHALESGRELPDVFPEDEEEIDW